MRTLLATCFCFGSLIAAPVQPLGFEQRTESMFLARSVGVPIRIARDRVVVGDVTLRFVAASGSATLEGVGRAAPSTYITRDRTVSFPQFTRLGIHRLYPGVDVVFYGSQNQLEYDLNLAPGASANRVRIAVDGARGMHLDADGNLVLGTASGVLRQLVPHVFETRSGRRREIPARYVLLAHNQIGFRLGPHDRRAPLTIDPVLVYAKYFGGSASDSASAVATDAQGNVYVAGTTNSVDFPVTTGGFQSKLTPPLVALSNNGQTVTPLPVANSDSVLNIGGTSDGMHLYIVTTSGIFVSHDGGATFNPASFFTTQPGSSAAVTLSVYAVTINSIAVDPVDPSRAFVATNLGLYGTNDNGQSWFLYDYGLAVGGGNSIELSSVIISPADHATLYASTTQPQYLYKSTDGAQSWQLLNPTFAGEQTFQPGYAPVPALTPDGSVLYVVDAYANLLKSTDGGQTWQNLAGGLSVTRQITIDPTNPSRIYILDNFGVERSTDGGQTFTNITPSDIQDASGDALGLDSSTGILYLSDYRHIDVSTDQGATWKTVGAFSGVQSMLGAPGRVLVGEASPSVPFVVKWDAAGDQMLYSTFFGGSLSDQINAINVDAQGDAILAGTAYSPDFPMTKTLSGPSPAGMPSGFVAKLSGDGSQLVYSTVMGASKGVMVNAFAVDASGSPYLTGASASPDFPTTAGVFQAKLPSSTCTIVQNPFVILDDAGVYAFVSKLSPDAGTLTFSTFLTGGCGSAGHSLAIDAAGDIVVAGNTPSTDFPTTAQAYQATYPGQLDNGFVAKLNATGTQLLAGTFIGGGYETEASAVTLDAGGNAYVTGSTWGITPGATAGAYQTQIDNNCQPGISIGPSPGPQNGNDAFVLKLDASLSAVQFLTYLGGGCADYGNSIFLDASGNPWIAGYTVSADFPLKSPFVGSGSSSFFVSQLSADGSQLLFSSYSDGAALAADPSGKVYIAGYENGLPGLKQTGTLASLAKLDPSSTAPVIIDSMGSASPFANQASAPSPLYGGVAPGELVEIHGQHLGPSQTVMAQLDDAGRVPLVVGATKVYFGPYLAPLISVQDSLIVCFVPFEVYGDAMAAVEVDGQSSNTVRIGVQSTNPQILAISNQDGTVNSADHPAAQGSVITLWVTGLGQTNPPSVDGMINVAPLPVPAVSVFANIQGPVQPEFVAAALGLAAGISQVNLQVPVATYPQNPSSVSLVSFQAPLYIGQ